MKKFKVLTLDDQNKVVEEGYFATPMKALISADVLSGLGFRIKVFVKVDGEYQPLNLSV